MMKRFISILCCLAVLTVSIPFSVTAEEKSIEFTEHILDANYYSDFDEFVFAEYKYGSGSPVFVIRSQNEKFDFMDYMYGELLPELNNHQLSRDKCYLYLDELTDNFFTNKALILVACWAPSLGYEYDKPSILAEENTITINYNMYEPLGAAPDACQNTVIILEVNKSDIDGYEKFLSKEINATEYYKMEYEGYVFDGYISDETLKKHVEETYGDDFYDAEICAYYGRHVNPFVITDFGSLEKFQDDSISEEFDDFAEGLADDFFDSKAIIAVYSKTEFSPVVYELGDIIDLDNGRTYYRIEFTVDESGANKGEQTNILVFVIDKLKGPNIHFSSWGYKINVLGDVSRSGDIDSMDYILTKRAYFGTFTLTKEQETIADINKNGKIDSMDYILIKRLYFGTWEPDSTNVATPDEIV